MAVRLRIALVAGALALACAGAAPSGRGAGNTVATGFPEPDALKQLARAPAPTDLPFRSRYRDVGAWDLEGPFPDVVGAPASRSGAKPWDALLDAFVRSRAGLVMATPAMECVAREAGRFFVDHRAFPGFGAQRFLAGRCAVATAPPSFASFSWKSSHLRSVQQAIDELADQIDGRLRSHVVGGLLDVGLWAHVEDGRLDVVVATGERVARIDPVPTVPADDGRVLLSGEFLRPAIETGALASRGHLGWQECEANEEVALPRFQYTCRVERQDAQAWLSLNFLSPGLAMPRVVARILVRPGAAPTTRYERHAYAAPRPVDDVEEVPTVFAELLNEVRRQAGAPPLRLEPEQSRTAAELAPHYFAAMANPSERRTAELVVRGMMAGWEVEAIVEEGRFTFMFLAESCDLASLLSDALDHPGARMTLLDPELERLAIGSMVGVEGEVEYVALIASTYELFPESEHRSSVERVYDNLAVARAERARPVPRPLEEVQSLAAAASLRIQAGEAPKEVLGDLILESVDTLKRPVNGWFAETRDLDALVFPDELLEGRQLDVAIAVAFRRLPDEPWGATSC